MSKKAAHLTRTKRVEVIFPSLRKKDRPALYKRLWTLQDEVRCAANLLMENLRLMENGLIPHPEEPPQRGPDKGGLPRPVPLPTLAYRAFNGEWQPQGEPLYKPSPGCEAAGGVAGEAASRARVALAARRKGVFLGKERPPFFRNGYGGNSRGAAEGLPIPIRAQEIDILPNNHIRLLLFQTGNTRVTVRPRKLDKQGRDIFNKLKSGEYKHGNGNLFWDQPKGRKGKWFFTISYTDTGRKIQTLQGLDKGKKADPLPLEDEEIIAGIDLGIANAIWITFVDAKGKPLKKPEVLHFPPKLLRAIANYRRMMRERSSFNRKALGLRAGRGQKRKFRANVKGIRRRRNLTKAMINELVAQAITICKARGATAIVLEDHGQWAVEKAHSRAQEEARTRSEAAKMRASFFRGHQGEMREKLRGVGEREGFKVVEIDPAWTSRTCHRCGRVWKRDWHAHPPGKEKSLPAAPSFGTSPALLTLRPPSLEPQDSPRGRQEGQGCQVAQPPESTGL